MAEQPELELDEAVELEAPLTETIRAVHTLFQREHVVSRQDLLVATLSELLSDGAKSEPELLREVNRAWPAAQIDDEDLREALRIASTAGLLQEARALDSTVLWHSTDAAKAESTAARIWAEGVRARSIREIRTRAEGEFGECADAQAQAFYRRVAQAVLTGIVNAESVFRGEVESVSKNSVRPLRFDHDAMLAEAARDASATTADFLKGCTIAALDPADPFGDELVTSISTTCVMQGMLSRADSIEARAALGPINKMEVVVDTNLLIDLLSPERHDEPLSRILNRALNAGAQIVLLEHYIEELAGLLEANRENAERHAGTLEARGEAYAALVRVDDILAMYSRNYFNGNVTSWKEFEELARNLPARLESEGWTRRPHGNNDREQVGRLRDALDAELDGGTARSPRTDSARARDAETLAMVARHRRRTARDGVVIGSLILTRDRRLRPAFEAGSSADATLVALNPASFGTLVSGLRGGPDISELAQATGRMLSLEVAERVAAKFPAAVALDVADALAGRGEYATDLRVAQMVVPVVESEQLTTENVVSQVMARRLERHRETSIRQGHALEEYGRELDDQSAAARNAKQSAQLEVDAARRARLRSQVEADRLRKRLDEALTPDEVSALQRRASIRAVATVLSLVVTIAIGFSGYVIPAFLVGIATVGIWISMQKWSSDLAVSSRAIFSGGFSYAVYISDGAALIAWLASLRQV